MTKCNVCKGSGYTRPKNRPKEEGVDICPNCEGTGEKGWSLAVPVVKCEKCKGTGKV